MSTPKQYRKKPVVIEAMRFPEGSRVQLAVREWVEAGGGVAHLYDGNLVELKAPLPDGSAYQWLCMSVVTIEGPMTASIGDYIIKGIQGEFYPCKPDIFAATYEEVSE